MDLLEICEVFIYTIPPRKEADFGVIVKKCKIVQKWAFFGLCSLLWGPVGNKEGHLMEILLSIFTMESLNIMMGAVQSCYGENAPIKVSHHSFVTV
jgi:hypothetical protein